MPRFEITAPDGRKFEVTAPEGASQDEVLRYAQENYSKAAPTPAPAPVAEVTPPATASAPTPVAAPEPSAPIESSNPMGEDFGSSIMDVAGPKVTPSKGLQLGLVPEQFGAGVTDMQQSWYTQGAKIASTNLNTLDRIDKGEKIPETEDPTGYQHMNAEQRKRTREGLEKTLTKDVAKALVYNAEGRTYLKNPSADVLVKAANDGDFAKAWEVFKDDYPGIIQQLSVKSAPNALPSLVGGLGGVLLRGGVPGLMAGLATGSFPVEYMSSLVDSLQDSGVDMTNAAAVEAKLRDPKFIEAMGKRAVTRATVIAAADAASGKLLLPLRAGQLGKNVARGAANIATEIGTEMGGEAGAQVASGEKLKVGDIIAEGLGAGPQAVGSTALKTVASIEGNPDEAVQRPKYKRDTSYEGEAERVARAKGFIPETSPETRPESSLRTPPVPPAPPAPKQEAVPKNDVDTRVKATVERMMMSGISENDALNLAPVSVQKEIDAERAAAERKQEAEGAKVPFTPVKGRVDELEQEFIGAGFDPKEARVRAEQTVAEETQADAEAAKATKRGKNAKQPVNKTSGASVPVVGQPSAVPDATGAEALVGDGAVRAGEDAAVPASGEGEQPAAVTPTPKEETPEVKEEPVLAKPAKPSKVLRQERLDLQTEQSKLKTSSGGIPAVKSKARKKWDALKTQIEEKQAELEAAYKYEELHPNEPVTETPVTEAPVAETPVAETPVAEAPAVETPVSETPAVETPVNEEPKRGRGRPKMELTPEQIQARQNEKGANRAAYMVGVRAFPKIEQQFNEAIAPVDEEIIESDEHLAEVENDKRANKRHAIRQLLELDQQHRGTALGKKVKALLNHKSITPQEIADVKRGLEVARKSLADKSNLLGPVTDHVDTSGPSSSQTEFGAGPADTEFSKVTNGAQAISRIIKTGTAFQKALAQRLRGFVVGVRVVVLEAGDPVPAQLQTARNAKAWERSRALFIENYDTGDKVIYVRGGSEGEGSQGINAVTILHELLHAATNRKIVLAKEAVVKGNNLNDPSVRAFLDLLQVMNNTKDLYNDMLDKGTLPKSIRAMQLSAEAFTDPREFVAYGLTDDNMQKFLQQAKGFKEDTSYFTRFVDTLRRMLGMTDDTVNALSDLIVVTDSLLTAPEVKKTKSTLKGEAASPTTKGPKETQEKAERSAVEIKRDVAIAKEKVRVSRATQEAKGVNLMQAARDPNKVRDIMKDLTGKMSYGQRKATVALPTMSFLVDWAKDDIPRLQEVHKHMQEMLGMSQTLLAGSEQIISSLRRTFKLGRDVRTKLENLVPASTIAQIDPSDPNATIRSTELDADYAALGKEGQAAYRMLRDYYKDLNSLYISLLDDQINGIEGMSPEEKKNLLAEIRKAFETGNKIEPYFPLVRKGDFWLAVHDKKQDKKIFTFETREERTRAARALAAERRVSLDELLENETFVQGNNMGELRKYTQNSSVLLTKLFDAIDSEELGSPEAREGLKDAVYQIYLNTMPEQSFRKMFIHRKNYAGFSTDLINNVAITASKMAMQLPRLKYAPKLQLSLSAARRSIVGRDELTPFIDEMEARVNNAVSGRPGGLSDAVAGVANKASYIWYLSAASSALIQPFSIALTGLPVLAANHGNPVRAGYELSKSLAMMHKYSLMRKNIDGTMSVAAPSLANNMKLPEDERRAIKEMTARGVNQSTQASLVWNYKQTPTDQLDTITAKGKKLGHLLTGALMHNLERLSREAIYWTSYRLSKQRGLTYNEAVDQAVIDTNESLGNYDINERPRYMQSGVGKTLLQFKGYPLHTTLYLATNFKRMLPLLNKEGKKEAVTKFFGTLFVAGMLGGAAGLPMFGAVMGLINWVWKQMRDDDDWPEELKDKDPETWFHNVFLPEHFGDITLGGKPLSDWVSRGPINALTGLSVSSRIGLHDLWSRDQKEMKTNRESFTAWVLDTFGGPSASLGLSMIDAYEAYAMGDYQKALEKSMPAVARNLIVAEKYKKEGIKTSRGAEIVPKDEVTAGELWGQRIGFRPERAARAQELAFKLTAVEQRVMNQRDQIMRKLNFQFQHDNFDKFDEIIQKEVVPFSARNPEQKIDADAIRDSILKQSKQRASSRAGVSLNPKNIRLFEASVSNLEKSIKSEEKPEE